jgi:hypothetical protein
LTAEMPNETCTELIASNIGWLQQGLSLLGHIDEATFVNSPQGLAPHRVGSHLRHVLEFYECFLDGLDASQIDYDARKRDDLIERSRHVAAAKICTILRRLEALTFLEDHMLQVRVENGDGYLASSVGRELQALSSHTIHHFALIAVTLRLHGIQVDPSFGMSPSTLRYRSARQFAATSEAA